MRFIFCLFLVNLVFCTAKANPLVRQHQTLQKDLATLLQQRDKAVANGFENEFDRYYSLAQEAMDHIQQIVKEREKLAVSCQSKQSHTCDTVTAATKEAWKQLSDLKNVINVLQKTVKESSTEAQITLPQYIKTPPTRPLEVRRTRSTRRHYKPLRPQRLNKDDPDNKASPSIHYVIRGGEETFIN